MTGFFLALFLAAAPLQEKRIPIPEAAQIREAEKAVKDLFKAEYARKTAADRASLARLLLQSATAQANGAERWVCLAQAQELAAQAGEWDVAWDAVGQTAAVFECDGPALKFALLSQAGKAVKTPEDAGRIAERSLKFVDELLRQEAVEPAEKAVASAQQLAKKSGNPALIGQAASKSREVADLKSGLEKSKKVREALAKNPDDPAANLEYGLFLCLSRGQWEKGLPHLARGTEGPYRSIALRELGSPEGAADQSGLGDFWWDHAEKDTGPAKASARARAAYWYDRALAGLEGLARVRAEKRLSEVEIAQTGGIDLLRLIDPEKDSVVTKWRKENGVLYSGMNFRSRLMVPYQPPEEYDLTMVFSTGGDGNPTYLGIVAGGTQCQIFIDGWNKTGIDFIDKKGTTLSQGTNFLNYGKGSDLGKDNLVVCSVRKKGISLTVNGKNAFSWEGPLTRLSLNPDWVVPNPQALTLGAWDRDLAIKKFSLTPVTGQGRRLR